MPNRSLLSRFAILFVALSLSASLTPLAFAQKAKPKTGNKAVELFNAGVKLQNEGDIEGAIAKYTEAIAASPTEFQSLANRGGLYRTKAVEILSAVDPSNPTLKAEAAVKAEEQFVLAVADYDAAIKVSPKSEFLFLGRAATQSARGKYELALADYDEYIKLKPLEARGYNDRGVALTEFARAEQATEKSADAGNKKAMPIFLRAVADFAKAIELDPKYALAYVNRGVCNWQLLKVDEALADYGKAIEIDPNTWKAYRSRAVIYKALGEDSKRSGDNAKAAEFAALQKADSDKYVEIQTRPPVTPTPAPAPAAKKK